MKYESSNESYRFTGCGEPDFFSSARHAHTPHPLCTHRPHQLLAASHLVLVDKDGVWDYTREGVHLKTPEALSGFTVSTVHVILQQDGCR